MKTGPIKFLHLLLLAILLFGTIATVPDPVGAQDDAGATEEVAAEPTTEPTEVPSPESTATEEPTQPPVEASETAEPLPAETPTNVVVEDSSQPEVVATKSRGAVGTSVSISISGFTPDSSLTVRWDRQELGSLNTNGDGEAALPFKVPASTAGVHSILVSSADEQFSIDFTVTPRTSVSPRQGTAGSLVRIKLTGYGQAERVSISIGGTRVKSVTTSSTGEWSGNIIVPDDAATGKSAVKARGDQGNKSSTTLTIESNADTGEASVKAAVVSGSLMVTTVDGASAPLSGACYSVYASNAGNRGNLLGEACDVTDGADGITNFGTLAAGAAILTESKAPDGYLPATASPITITVNQLQVSVTNEPNDDLTILNFDETGAPLPGSCYIVYTDIGGGSLGNFLASACDSDDQSDDGVVHFGTISNGNRVLVEKVVPRGYARVAQQTFVHDGAKPKAISIQHQTGGAIVVTKVNDIGDSLNGACFDAYIDLKGVPGNFVDRGCNPDGNLIVIDGLKVGKYFLVESSAPVGYKKAANTSFTIAAKTDVAVTIVNVPTTKLIARKKSEADRPLKGACFDVYRANGAGRGDRVQKNKCDKDDGKEDGYLTLPLPPGDYILVETKAPEGYLIGTDTKFTIKPGLDTDIDVTNVLGGTIKVTTVDETGQYENPRDACYTVWSSHAANKVKLGSACDVSDGTKDGVTSISGLPGGKLFLQQSKVPWGFFKGTDFDVQVTIRKTVAVDYLNEPWPLLIINKVDEKGDPLGGACFTAYVDLGGGKRGTQWVSPEGPLCDKDGDGLLYALVTPGNQILVETKSPVGYLPVQDTPFTMVRGQETELTVANYRVGFIYITKKSVAGDKLNGACFEAYHNVNGKRGAKAASGCDRESGAGSLNKVMDAITILNGLTPGEYWIAEKTAPTGYFKAADVLVTVELSKTEVTILDEPWPVLTITKVNDKGAVLKGACFQLFKIKDGKRGLNVSSKVCGKTSNVVKISAAPGTYILGEVTTPAGYVKGKDIQVTIVRGATNEITVVNTPAGFVKVTNINESDKPLRGSCWEVWTDASGKPGKRVVRGCDTKSSTTPAAVKLEAPPGNYWLIQATTPTGYKPASNLRMTIVARETLSVTVKNLPYPRFVVNSVDGANKPLPGACFDLYLDAGSKLGTKVATALCDNSDKLADGTTSRRLAPGRYVAREVTAPSRYAKAPDFKFTIVENTDLVLTLQHQLAGILVVNTKDSGGVKLTSACFELWTKLEDGSKGILVAKACDKESSDSSSKLDGSTTMRALPPGSYLLVQSFATTGYKKAANSTVTILGGSTTTVNVVNNKS